MCVVIQFTEVCLKCGFAALRFSLSLEPQDPTAGVVRFLDFQFPANSQFILLTLFPLETWDSVTQNEYTFKKMKCLFFLRFMVHWKRVLGKKKTSQQQQTKPMCIFFLNYLWFSFSAEISSFHVAGLSPTLLFQKVQAGHVRLKHCTFISNHRFQSIKALFL